MNGARNLETLPTTWETHQPAAEQRTLEDLLATFEPIKLSEMNEAKLLDRSEVKYVLPHDLLMPVLREMRGAYRVFVAAGLPWSRNRTLYYDTDGLALYLRHHAGARERYKVRTREYVDSHLAFLEVKHKVSECHTVKRRITVPAPLIDLDGAAADFLSDIPYPADQLNPKVWNYSTRVTLVSQNRPERVTLDLDLAFSWDDALVMLPGIVVAEVKYQGRRGESEFVQMMHRRHVRDTSFSKYCLGVSMLYPEVKHNKFKAKQRLVARLSQGDNYGTH